MNLGDVNIPVVRLLWFCGLAITEFWLSEKSERSLFSLSLFLQLSDFIWHAMIFKTKDFCAELYDPLINLILIST